MRRKQKRTPIELIIMLFIVILPFTLIATIATYIVYYLVRLIKRGP